jgi:LmbE family N-acetylglucosaminyl deacetylase
MPEHVLVIAPHPDDEAIGCGGAICLHRLRGDPVQVVFLTSGEHGLDGVTESVARATREAEAAAAARELQISGLEFLRLPDQSLWRNRARAASKLKKVLEKQRPRLIYLPHPDDNHPDHEATLPIVCRALSKAGHQEGFPELRGYEIWSPMARYGWVEDISGVMRQKLRAVCCYHSQLRVFSYDRAIRGLNAYRGVLAAGSRYAEAFVYLDPEMVGQQPVRPRRSVGARSNRSRERRE